MAGGAIQRAHHADPVHHPYLGAASADFPHRAAVQGCGVAAALGGLFILLGGWLVYALGSSPGLFIVAAPTDPGALGVYWLGVAAGGVVLLLGVLAFVDPRHHATFGPLIVIASGFSLLAGPLLWVGLILGLIAGAIMIPLGAPPASEVVYYTPVPVAYAPMAPLLAPSAPVPSTPPSASVYCSRCGRMSGAGNAFCWACGATLATPPTR